MIDLHVHTTCSDGSFTPAEIVTLANSEGLKAIAITDHDTVSGIAEGFCAGKRFAIEVISGVEVSAQWDTGNCHILGYFVDVTNPSLLYALGDLEQSRSRRIENMLQKLQGIGLDISWEQVSKHSNGILGRPHVAKVLVENGVVSSIQEGFELYLGKGKPGYVPNKKLSPDTAVQLIKDAGGIAVLAHPYTLCMEQEGHYILEKKIKEVISYGVSGIEVYYPKHSRNLIKLLLKIAREMDLVVTGGSDFHGDATPGTQLGVIPDHPPLPYSIVDALKRCL